MTKHKRSASKTKSKKTRLAELLDQVEFSLSDLEEIGEMSALRELRFKPGSTFAKGGLAHLARVRNLQFLAFEESKLSARDLAACAACAKLRRLSLEGCSFPAKGLAALVEAARLKDLWLQRTAISDAGLVHLAGLSALDWLILDDTKISDRGLRQLVGLPNLRTLRLRNTRVTNAGVLALAAAPKVRFVLGCFAGTKVTQEGLDAAFAERRGAAKRGSAQRAPSPASAEDEAAASEVLRGFIKAVHAWEKACHKGSKEGRELGEFARDREAIFARSCTNKKRAYSEVAGYSVPPEYNPRTEKIQAVEAKSRSRIEILTRRRGAERRLYVLLRKAGEWRIDSVKSTSGGAFRPAIL